MPRRPLGCSFSSVNTTDLSRRSASSVQVRRLGDDLVLVLAGDWNVHSGIPSIDDVAEHLIGAEAAKQVTYVSEELGSWDSSLLTFLVRVVEAAALHRVPENREGLPAGVRGMLRLAEAVPESGDVGGPVTRYFFVVRLGLTTIEVTHQLKGMLEFVGEVTVALLKWMTGRASYRRSDLWLSVQQAGVEAMPIVALVSFLMGVILAFVGAIQLQQFGAAIYVADLVGIAMVRDIAALMTGIIMAGRSGAAYAAEIGSMQVNEEVDALTTIGVSPVEFLVLPRLLALVFMMPLLTIYADFVSILGGMLVGVGMLGQSFTAYTVQTLAAVNLTHVIPGIIKGTTYGAIVAMSGCLRGLQSGRSSLAVGAAATSAVVTAIVHIIAAAGVFSVVSYVLGI
jgi:phospholipid/cholesterol/gamma-HCH transport system permease protein